MSQTLLSIQITVFVYVIIGIILGKKGIIDDKAQTFLSDFIVSVLLPLSVFTSLYSNLSLELLKQCSVALILAVIFEMLVYLFIKADKTSFMDEKQKAVAHYSYMVSNGGLIGTPIIEGLFGATGVVICNVFLIPTRIMAFASGESIFNPSAKKGIRETSLSILTNKVIIALLSALALKVSNIDLPAPIMTALINTGKCMSPLSLILVGSLLTQKLTLKKDNILRICLISLIRLIVIPVIVLFACTVFHIDHDTKAIAALLLGMPAGSTAAIFARKYNGDTEFASMTVMITTILSSVSLLIVSLLIDLV